MRLSLTSPAAAVLAASTLLLSIRYSTVSAQQSQQQQQQQPRVVNAANIIDWHALGGLGLVGRFAGVSRTDITPPAHTLLANGTVSSLVRITSDRVNVLVNAVQGGQIFATCSMSGDITSVGHSNGTVNSDPKKPWSHLVFIGGQFAGLNSVAARNVAAYNVATGEITSLDRGLDGPVSVLYCDPVSGTVVAGGNFTAPIPSGDGSNTAHYTSRSKYGGGLAAWNASASAWMPVPLVKGVHGTVSAIASSPDRQIIYIGGAFNRTADASDDLSPFSQPVNLNAGRISAGNSGGFAGWSDPANIVCTPLADAPGNTWLLQDNAPGYWRMDLATPVRPALIRIMNTIVGGRGTRSFRLDAVPLNRALTLAYFDPSTGSYHTCRDSCPLRQDLSWQEFRVVDNIPPTTEPGQSSSTITGISLHVNEWYGLSGGLTKIELYQRDVISYAVHDLNTSPCATTPFTATSSFTGAPWTLETPNVRTAPFMKHAVASTDDGTSNAAAVTFTPYIAESGNYKVWLHIPGCEASSDCASRTQYAHATLELTSQSNSTLAVNVDQRVNGDVDTLLYTGFVEKTSAKHQPRVTVGLATEAFSSNRNNGLVLVAESVRFEKIETLSNLGGVLAIPASIFNTATAAASASASNDNSASSLDTLQTLQNAAKSVTESLPSGSIVSTIVPSPDGASLFVGGMFTNSTLNIANVAELPLGSSVAKSLPHSSNSFSGLNGPVSSLVLADNYLYAAGSFSNSTSSPVAGLRNVARLRLGGSKDSFDSQWEPMFGGVNGPVEHAVAFASSRGNGKSQKQQQQSFTRIVMAGSFSALHPDVIDGQSPIRYPYMAAWDPSDESWDDAPLVLGSNSRSAAPEVVESVSAHYDSVTGEPSLLVSGAFVNVDSHRASDTLGIDGTGVISSALTINQFNSGATINAGAYLRASDLNVEVRSSPGSPGVLVAAGNFTAKNISNVAVLRDMQWHPLTQTAAGLAGEVSTLAVADSRFLFFGGKDATSASPTTPADELPVLPFTGFAAYNLDTDAYESNIPRLSVSSSGNPGGDSVHVRRIAVQSGSTKVIVGGRFDAAGSLPCTNICMWDYDYAQWSPLDGGIEGTVTDVLVLDKTVYVAGTLRINSNSGSVSTHLASYSLETTQWTVIDKNNVLPGQVDMIVRCTAAISSASSSSSDSSAKSIIVSGKSSDNGSVFMHLWNGSSLIDLLSGSKLDTQHSRIDALRIVPLVSNSETQARSATKQPMFHFESSVLARSSDGGSNNAHSGPAGLLIGGDLQFGANVSTSLAVFDGASWHPYLMLDGTGDGLSNGKIASIFYGSEQGSGLPTKVPMPVALVIFIAIAISLGLVFIIVLLGMLYIYWRNNRRISAAVAAAAAAGQSTQPYYGSDSVPRSVAQSQYMDHRALGSLDASVAAAAAAAAAGMSTGVRQAITSTNLTQTKTSRAAVGTTDATVGLANMASATTMMGSPSTFGQEKTFIASSEPESFEKPASLDTPAVLLASQPVVSPVAVVNINNNSNSGTVRRSIEPERPRHNDRSLAQARYSVTTSSSVPVSGVDTSTRGTYEDITSGNESNTGTGTGSGSGTSNSRTDSSLAAIAAAAAAAGSRPANREPGPGIITGANAVSIRDSLRGHPIYYARFAFHPREHGELGFTAGERIFVIDNTDDIWWMGVISRENDSLAQGVFPASYVSEEPPSDTTWDYV
ncbi:hypothetical protein GQ42DRAFT_164273 [Ramicandelaber brevisporus]|nr:hypothetical protein GQ42DRAFT_164273 [Ramicandelaber brevisporus]